MTMMTMMMMMMMAMITTIMTISTQGLLFKLPILFTICHTGWIDLAAHGLSGPAHRYRGTASL
jgi:hypothetical protein